MSDEEYASRRDRVHRRPVGGLDVDAVVKRPGVGGIEIDASGPRPRVAEGCANWMLAVEWPHRPVVGGCAGRDSQRDQRADQQEPRGRTQELLSDSATVRRS